MHQPTTRHDHDDRRTSPSAPATGRRPLLALLLATALLYLVGLGTLDFWAPDEPRYGAIAEELRSLRHGARGFVLLHLNDVPYTQKPPLYFWLAALFGAPGGRVSELAARLPSALAGIAAVALTAWIGRRVLGRTVPALIAAALLATSFRFAFTARRAQLDVLLTSFELAAIACFWRLESKPGGIESARKQPVTIAALHAGLGAAGLVKGPVGWLPLGVFAAYLVWEGRGRALRQILPWWGWTLSIGPLAVWAATAIALGPPGFAEAALGDNLLGRFFAGTSHARPFYYYLYQLPLDFLPWSLLLPFGLPLAWRAARAGRVRSAADPGTESGTAPGMESGAAPGGADTPAAAVVSRSGARWLIAWVAVPLLFFSLSAGKRGVYFLPVFPALALIAALAFSRPEFATRRAPRWRAPVLAIALVAGIEAGVALVVLPRLDEEKSPRSIAVAAAAQARPGEAVGVLGMSPIEGALGYYGGLAVASLRTRAELERFLAEGGRLILLRDRDLDSLGPELGLRAVAASRSGRRRLALAVASD